jgi:hypothetical protein
MYEDGSMAGISERIVDVAVTPVAFRDLAALRTWNGCAVRPPSWSAWTSGASTT